eukprot:1646575-Rhodomonas_salina.1
METDRVEEGRLLLSKGRYLEAVDVFSETLRSFYSQKCEGILISTWIGYFPTWISFMTVHPFVVVVSPSTSSSLIAKLLSYKSEALAGAERYKEAASDAEQIIAIKPEWSQGHYRSGVALLGLKDFEGAEATDPSCVHAILILRPYILPNTPYPDSQLVKPATGVRARMRAGSEQQYYAACADRFGFPNILVVHAGQKCGSDIEEWHRDASAACKVVRKHCFQGEFVPGQATELRNQQINYHLPPSQHNIYQECGCLYLIPRRLSAVALRIIPPEIGLCAHLHCHCGTRSIFRP